MALAKRDIVIASPFIIIAANFALAYAFGQIIGKWAFIPMILLGWVLWLFFIFKYGGKESVKKWVRKPTGSFGWNILAIIVGLIPLPLFLLHYDLLNHWTIWLPWILLALINPWIEEFYWRGLLLDYTKSWSNWTSVLFVSILFALNHAAFGINSEVNSGLELVISTFIMGIVWAWVYKKTNSIRWAIFSHFLVDFLGVSAAAFLDLYQKGSW
tara:strand:+ start:12825 stop:13463 length:639 start_codon:yes stop_codon:yes gene_type:complete